MDARRRELEHEGRAALTDHAADCAYQARQRHGEIDTATLPSLLADDKVVRYPTELCLDAGPLEAGEFAYAEPRGAHPRDGFRLCVHPHFAGRAELPLLVAYHLVAINYGEIATREQAEVFGALLLGLDPDEYYERVCRLADEVAAQPDQAGCGGGSCR